VKCAVGQDRTGVWSVGEGGVFIQPM
jgi:hypothetical protein